ncbi:hypothetical protein [Emticicia sp. 21SJ11W-3]|uniref:hypothetical protein n=1 Tax=Emticicia sp. 21SJ11W-3 TaxID=2916755 RepID=UPI00209EE941|nr:hypothetical protein [Emticicia sp. 21SJ11W-3]UTA66673.1 hypothetical protein MB380_13790 [Emticicia sp. 21SJ11W-3]
MKTQTACLVSAFFFLLSAAPLFGQQPVNANTKKILEIKDWKSFSQKYPTLLDTSRFIAFAYVKNEADDIVSIQRQDTVVSKKAIQEILKKNQDKGKYVLGFTLIEKSSILQDGKLSYDKVLQEIKAQTMTVYQDVPIIKPPNYVPTPVTPAANNANQIDTKLNELKTRIDSLWKIVYPTRNPSEWRNLENQLCITKADRLKYRTNMIGLLTKLKDGQ